MIYDSLTVYYTVWAQENRNQWEAATKKVNRQIFCYSGILFLGGGCRKAIQEFLLAARSLADCCSAVKPKWFKTHQTHTVSLQRLSASIKSTRIIVLFVHNWCDSAASTPLTSVPSEVPQTSHSLLTPRLQNGFILGDFIEFLELSLSFNI